MNAIAHLNRAKILVWRVLFVRLNSPGCKMIANAALSLLCSLLMLVTGWLLLPIFVLLPLSLFFASRFYKKVRGRSGGSSALVHVLALAPAAIALAALPALVLLFQHTYRA